MVFRDEQCPMLQYSILGPAQFDYTTRSTVPRPNTVQLGPLAHLRLGCHIHPPLGLDVLVEASNQLTHMGQEHDLLSWPRLYDLVPINTCTLLCVQC